MAPARKAPFLSVKSRTSMGLRKACAQTSLAPINLPNRSAGSMPDGAHYSETPQAIRIKSWGRTNRTSE
jgi:hypothetical protein